MIHRGATGYSMKPSETLRVCVKAGGHLKWLFCSFWFSFEPFDHALSAACFPVGCSGRGSHPCGGGGRGGRVLWKGGLAAVPVGLWRLKSSWVSRENEGKLGFRLPQDHRKAYFHNDTEMCGRARCLRLLVHLRGNSWLLPKLDLRQARLLRTWPTQREIIATMSTASGVKSRRGGTSVFEKTHLDSAPGL